MAKETEIQIENYLKFNSLRQKSEQKLTNQNFLNKAKAEMIAKEKIAFEDFVKQEQQNYNIIVQKIFQYFENDERIYWHIQYCREKSSIYEEYSSDWFKEYLKPIENSEYIILAIAVKEFL